MRIPNFILRHSLLFVLVIGALLFFLPPFLKMSSIWEWFNMSGANKIGDAVGGLTAPIIGFGVILFTYLAFWAQYIANRQQNRFARAQRAFSHYDNFERSFFTFIESHRKNVDEIVLRGKNDSVKGKECFYYFFNEIKFIYLTACRVLETQQRRVQDEREETENIGNEILEYDRNNLSEISYLIFYFGLNPHPDRLHYDILFDYDPGYMGALVSELETYVQDESSYDPETGVFHLATSHSEEVFDNPETYNESLFKFNFSYKPFQGHNFKVSHYFRHLFQTIRFLKEQNFPSTEIPTNQEDEGVLNIIENDHDLKYTYAKNLRSLLSNYEQILLHLNSLSRLGEKWREMNINGEEWNLIKEFCLIKHIPLNELNFGPEIESVYNISEDENVNEYGNVFLEWREISRRRQG